MGNLTDSRYWGEQQHGLDFIHDETFDRMTEFEWLDVIEPFLKKFEGQKFLELGCSPGITSAAISKRVSFEFHGVDFSPQSSLYSLSLKKVGIQNATLYQTDLRMFDPKSLFDVVASFGLLEHFTDIQTIFNHHDRLLRKGGLCVIVIPNFRKLPFLYHYLFNRSDLKRHNLDSMHLYVLEKLALQRHQKILFLDYIGKLKFWNVELKGGRFYRITKRVLSKIVRQAAGWGGMVLPEGHPFFAPWIVYVGEKQITS